VSGGVSAASKNAVGLDDPEELLQRADAVIAAARPGEQVEVSLGESIDTEIRAYGGAVESLSSARSVGALVRVIVGGRSGVATTTLTDPETLAWPVGRGPHQRCGCRR
jgi:PmbA protein